MSGRTFYMQQRYYDPIAARFMSLDPVTTDANTGASFGRYHYANNSPYVYTDPDGRDAWYREPPPTKPPPPENLGHCQSATGTNCGWGSYTSSQSGGAIAPATAANAPGGPQIDPTWGEIGAVADGVATAASFTPIGMPLRGAKGATTVIGRVKDLKGLVIAPGFIDTERMKHLYAGGGDPAGARREDEATIPARRFGRPEEIGDVVAFLCSARAAYITGTTLLVDGGLARGLLS